jgi:hypothetical protein
LEPKYGRKNDTIIEDWKPDKPIGETCVGKTVVEAKTLRIAGEYMYPGGSPEEESAHFCWFW